MLTDVVRSRLEACHPGIATLEEAVLAGRLPPEYAAVLADEGDCARARLYFFLYTVPVLEGVGLLDDPTAEQARDCAVAQLGLGLHLRYLDYLVDADRAGVSTLDTMHRAQAYLGVAREALQRRGTMWGAAQEAVYLQFLWYEQEVRAGQVHTLGSLWRRVSPLCVIPDTYGPGRLFPRPFPRVYRDYLAWSLVQADCADVLADLQAERVTPVTRVVRERMQGAGTELLAAAEAVSEVKRVLEGVRQRLLAELASCPVWATVILSICDPAAPPVSTTPGYSPASVQ